jgi:spore maturation protein CgeB
MKFVFFCHSLTSDWNHGNAHFLRGVTTELAARGHGVKVYEPADGWSLRNLVRNEGVAVIDGFRRHYPLLQPRRYTMQTLDLDAALDGADVVIVHEWNPPELFARIGMHRRLTRSQYRLFFHDTHHRAVSAPDELAALPLDDFDGALVFGEALAAVYRQRGWGDRVWVWHEAADTRVFTPRDPDASPQDDLIWIGNWGEDERTRELHEFLVEPALMAGVRGSVYGVRYPETALAALARAGLNYRGWLPNYEVPRHFHRHRFTLHVPRRFYRETLPGIPTIRVFEALACGIPLISAPWSDTENLFRPGRDFLVVGDGREATRAMRDLQGDRAMADELAAAGRETLERRHTCAHRVTELLDICASLDPPVVTLLTSAPRKQGDGALPLAHGAGSLASPAP